MKRLRITKYYDLNTSNVTVNIKSIWQSTLI